MTALMITFVIAWLVFPFFGVPYSIVKHNECSKLKKQLEALEFELTKLNSRSAHNRATGYSAAPVQPELPSEAVSDTYIKAEEAQVPETAAESAVLTFSEEETLMHDHPADDFLPSDEAVNQKSYTKAKNISGLLITGVSLVLLAGLIFVTTNWNTIGEGFKIFIIMLATGMFFGASAFTEKKLGLKSTGKGFFILGTLFIPITCVSFFFFEIFGSWFSFNGEGIGLALMSVFLSCSLSCFMITRKYKTVPSAFAAMMFISAAVISFGFFTEWLPAFMIITVSYSAMLLAVRKESLIKHEVPFAYINVFGLFSRINAFVMAFTGFTYAASEGSTWTMAAAVLFALAVTVFIQLTTENKTADILCRILTAAEYIIFAFIVSDSFSHAFNDTSFSLVLVCMMIPAAAVSIFVPALKSQITSSVLNSFIFLYSMALYSDVHPLCSLIIIVMTVTSALCFSSVPAAVQASVYSVPLLWQFFSLMNISDENTAFIISLAVSVFFAGSVLLSRKSSSLKSVAVISGIYTLFIPVISGIIFCDRLMNLSSILTAAAAFGAVSYISFRNNNSAVKVLSAVASSVCLQICALLLFTEHLFIRSLMHSYNDSDMFFLYICVFAVTAAVAAAGVLIHRSDESSGKTVVYTSVFITLVTALINGPDSDGLWPFVFKTVFIAYLAVCGMVSGKISSKVFYSLASVVGAYALATQNFIEISDVIKPEYCIFCSFVPYFFLFRLFRENKKTVNMIMFVQSCICMFILGLGAIESENLVHALTIGIVSVAVIMVSAFTADRKWRVFGTVSLVLLVLYMTRDFWASLAWWVYLLVAGIILIAYAAFNEYCRKTGSENIIKNAVKSVFSRSSDR